MLNFNKKKYVSFDNLKSFNGLLQSSLKEKLDGYKSEINTKVQKKFNELSGKVQTDSEVIDARKGEASLRAKIDVIDEDIKNVSSQLEHIEKKITVSVKDFGAVGDGITDDTEAIKRMCEFVNNIKYANIIFPNGIYKVSVEDRDDYWYDNHAYIAKFNSCDVNIDLCNSTIRVESNRIPFYSIFKFTNSSYEIKNGKLIGDRPGHIYKEYRGLTTHEWGYGIAGVGSKGKVSNMEISQFTGDGINSEDTYRQTPSGFETLSKAFIEIDKCNIHHCRRQGITIGESHGGIIKNTRIQYIGDFDGIPGTDPKSGIDLEFELGTSYCDSVVIDNVTISDCTNFSIVGAINGDIIDNFILKNSTIDGRIILTTPKKGIIYNTTLNLKYTNGISEFKDLRFDNCNIHCVGPMFLRNNTFNNCYITGEYDDRTGSGTSIQCDTNVTFNNCTIKDILGNSVGFNWPSVLNGKPLVGFNLYQFDAEYNFNNCTISNCSSIIKPSNTNIFKVNNSIVKNCYFMHESTDKPLIQYNNCDIENLCGYLGHKAKYLFKNCNIKDNNTMPLSFVGFGLSILHNCNVDVLKKSKDQHHYYIEAYNSYLNYDNPSDSNLYQTKLYNCYFTCNTSESSFNGTKQNTTYITK